MSRLEDEWEIRRLTYLYARAMDRNEPETLERIFTADAVLEGASSWRGVAEIRKIPGWLRERFVLTSHHVHNHLAEVDGDRATAETYGLAHMIGRGPSGNLFDLQLSIRYQDDLLHAPDGWRFTRRILINDWSATTTPHLEAND